jgi:DHA2 family multidrug resistance protein-like MFS transporter
MAQQIASAPGQRAGRQAWIGLAVLALPTLLISIDVFVMLLALPHISEALHASSVQQLWIMDMYGFMLSGCMITMGTLGDRIGRRKLLLIGASAFGLVSIVAAYSTSAGTLIAARAALGIAGATLAPSTLALITNMFRDTKQRGLAIGIWFVCFMGGAALGPVVGGLLLAHFWWGSVFLVGVPPMALLLILGPMLLPEFRDRHAGRIDLISVGLSLAAILPFIYGVKELARDGWTAGPAASLLIGLAVGVLFIRRQRSLADPLLDLRLFANPAFSGALGSMLFGTMLMGALMLFLTEHLQLVEGLSALDTGLWMLPVSAGSIVSLVCSPLLARRFRPAHLIAAGLVVSIAGLLVITQVGTGSSPVRLILGWVIINVGSGPFVTLTTELVLGSVPPGKAGSAAAINETSGEFGFAVGIAVLGSIGAAVYRAGMASAVPSNVPQDAALAARDTLTGATAAAGSLPNDVLTAAKDAFTSGMHVIAGLSAVLLLGVAIVVVRLLRQVPASGRPVQAKPAEPEPVAV